MKCPTKKKEMLTEINIDDRVSAKPTAGVIKHVTQGVATSGASMPLRNCC
jgi:hypothetical protein